MSCSCRHRPEPTSPLTRGEALDNAASAAGRALGAFLRGQPVRVSAETRAARLGACSACARRVVAADGGEWCAACGCALALKSGLATEGCPDGRWPGAVASAR